jgi:membrane-bound lytic murein transglycosylase MltF
MLICGFAIAGVGSTVRSEIDQGSGEGSVCTPGQTLNLPDLKALIPKLSRGGALHTKDLPAMQKHKVIRVLTNYSKTNYFIEDGHFFGFEYSLMKEFERFVNLEVKSDRQQTTVEFIPVPRSMLIPSLIQGMGDIVAAGLASGRNLPREVVFTYPYIEKVGYVLVTHGGAPALTDLSDLSGRQVYVLPAEAEYKVLGILNRLMAKRGLKPMRIVKAEPVLCPEDILEMVNAGIVDLTITPKHLAGIWSRIFPHLKIYEPDFSQPSMALAWLVRKKNPLLKASLDRFAEDHKKGTRLGNIYFRKYFENTQWIKNPLDTVGQERLSLYAPLFQKYGARYGIDWRILAAVAYEESGLDPNSRSRKGAVGLMQILPSTAMDRRINIRNSHTIENNIHAGAKYLALLRDQYFSGKDVSSESRIRFALAAYNAGPEKIRLCRQLARSMGYRGDRWFHHCEQAALSLHLTETVQYVSDVNKYLLAYRLSETLDCLKERMRDQHLRYQ